MKQSKEFEQIKSLFDVLQTCRVESGGLAPMQEEGEGEPSVTPVLTVDELTNKVVELLENLEQVHRILLITIMVVILTKLIFKVVLKLLKKVVELLFQKQKAGAMSTIFIINQ